MRPDTPPVTDRTDQPTCPSCGGALHHIYSAAGGGRLRCELSMYRCPVHGFVYRTREGLQPPDDFTSPVTAPLFPRFTPSVSSAAVPEPQEDLPNEDTLRSILNRAMRFVQRTEHP